MKDILYTKLYNISHIFDKISYIFDKISDTV